MQETNLLGSSPGSGMRKGTQDVFEFERVQRLQMDVRQLLYVLLQPFWDLWLSHGMLLRGAQIGLR